MQISYEDAGRGMAGRAAEPQARAKCYGPAPTQCNTRLAMAKNAALGPIRRAATLDPALASAVSSVRQS